MSNLLLLRSATLLLLRGLCYWLLLLECVSKPSTGGTFTVSRRTSQFELVSSSFRCPSATTAGHIIMKLYICATRFMLYPRISIVVVIIRKSWRQFDEKPCLRIPLNSSSKCEHRRHRMVHYGSFMREIDDREVGFRRFAWLGELSESVESTSRKSKTSCENHHANTALTWKFKISFPFFFSMIK